MSSLFLESSEKEKIPLAEASLQGLQIRRILRRANQAFAVITSPKGVVIS